MPPATRIFFSYASEDDTLPTEPGAGGGWASGFIKSLQNMLAWRIGGVEKVDLWWDTERIRGNARLSDELRDHAENADVFVMLLSPSWLSSGYCRQELDWFCAAHPGDAHRRLFAIKMMPRSRMGALPEQLDDIIGFDAYERRDTGPPALPYGYPRPSADDEDFIQFVYRVCGALENLIATGDLTRDAGAAAREAAREEEEPEAEAEPSKGAVYVADVSDDLDHFADRVRSTLAQYGFEVLPREQISREEASFQEEAGNAMRDAALCVQLLSYPGRPTSLFPEGFVAYQQALAATLDKPVLKWRRDAALEDFTDGPHHEMLTAPDVRGGLFNEFLRDLPGEIEEALKPPPTPPARATGAPAAASLVFLQVSPHNRSLGEEIGQRLSQARCSAFLPPRSGASSEIRRIVAENIAYCDGVVLIYGEQDEDWINAAFMQTQKAAVTMREDALHFLAIYDSPPEEKPGLPAFLSPDIKVIDARRGFDADRFYDATGIRL